MFNKPQPDFRKGTNDGNWLEWLLDHLVEIDKEAKENDYKLKQPLISTKIISILTTSTNNYLNLKTHLCADICFMMLL